MEHQVVPRGDDENAGLEIEAFSALSLSIAFVLVSLRLHVPARMVKKLWWDDWFFLLGIVRTPWNIALHCANSGELFSTADFGLVAARVNSGYWRHMSFLLPKQIMSTTITTAPFFLFSSMFTKLSTGLFLLRILGANRAWKTTMYIIIALVVATNVSSACICLSLCKPMAKLWKPTILATCWSQGTRLGINYYQGSKRRKDTVYDTILMPIPPRFCRLHGLFTGVFAFLLLERHPNLVSNQIINLCADVFGSIVGIMTYNATSFSRHGSTGICAINRTVLTSRLVYVLTTWVG